jgi:hypothetical protein
MNWMTKLLVARPLFVKKYQALRVCTVMSLPTATVSKINGSGQAHYDFIERKKAIELMILILLGQAHYDSTHQDNITKGEYYVGDEHFLYYPEGRYWVSSKTSDTKKTTRKETVFNFGGIPIYDILIEQKRATEMDKKINA